MAFKYGFSLDFVSAVESIVNNAKISVSGRPWSILCQNVRYQFLPPDVDCSPAEADLEPLQAEGRPHQACLNRLAWRSHRVWLITKRRSLCWRHLQEGRRQCWCHRLLSPTACSKSSSSGRLIYRYHSMRLLICSGRSLQSVSINFREFWTISQQWSWIYSTLWPSLQSKAIKRHNPCNIIT